jgi:RNA-binding protein
MNTPTSKELRQLRALAHKLRPVVTIAGKGLSDTVLEELDRALNDHELIKVKVAVGDREQRESVIAEACERSNASLVQRIGNIATLLRANPQADPKKSNLHRY